MMPGRWQHIERLYYAALQRDASQRAAFLDEACTDDAALRREVETLLQAHDRAGSFLAGPILQTAVQEIAQSEANSLVGRQLGAYKVLSLLGAGGMGEVYLAQDTRLGRKIALKILPGQFTQDPDRMSRFEREARPASALNHPNILTIHDVGRVEETTFIATEFVDGITLRQKMTNQRLERREMLDIVIQIASALAAAHQAGIIHRDVKPENIMVRQDGYVKVLDFGLACTPRRER
jgi:serine/threonine protein kinase